jgi:hypothetical protein
MTQVMHTGDRSEMEAADASVRPNGVRLQVI